MGKRKSASWMYMSRLAAQKEWAFMKVSQELTCQPRGLKWIVGLARARIPGSPAYRSSETLYPDGVYRCISLVSIVGRVLYIFPTQPISRRQISEVPSPGKLYSSLMDLIVRFARSGLIHGDFNEFNILIRRTSGEAIVIDFPQMVSTSHTNAEW